MPKRAVVSVMAHHTRQDATLELMQRPDIGVVGVSVEDGHGENDTGARAWRQLNRFDGAPQIGWGIVLQDDALPVEGFIEHAITALNSLSERAIVSFYTGTGQPRPNQVQIAVDSARDHGHAWLSCDALLWGVAVAIPIDLVGSAADYLENSTVRYDTALGRWATNAGLSILYTNPSLVDHADGPSLAHPDARNMVERRAHSVGHPSSWHTGVSRIAARF